MTITHELNDQVEAYLKTGQFQLAIDLLAQNGWPNQAARQQVGAVARDLRADKARERERAAELEERREGRQLGLLDTV